jgi:M6 family metalloprotease-like protein
MAMVTVRLVQPVAAAPTAPPLGPLTDDRLFPPAPLRSRGNSSVLDVPGTSVQTGSKPFVTILCRFPDVPFTPQPKSFFEQKMSNEYGGLDHWWREVSNGNINLQGSIVVGWYDMPYPKSHYITDENIDFTRLVEDAASLADADVYFPSYYGINLAFNDSLGCCAWGVAGWSLARDGQSKTYGVTWMPSSIITHEWFGPYFGHEMGHAFGLDHSGSTAEGAYWDADGMTNYTEEYGRVRGHYNIYHKAMLGWIPPQRQYTATTGTSRGIFIERSALPSANGTYLLAQVPINGSSTLFYTVESRLPVGYDAVIATSNGTFCNGAVVIHRVETNTGADDSQVVGPEGKLLPTLEEASWTVGETFTDSANGIRIAVTSATSTGFNVSIAMGADLPLAANDSAVINEDSGASLIRVLDNDTDPNGDALTLKSATGGTMGGIVNGQPGGTTLAYTPPANFFGTDTFTYTVQDGHGGEATASVTVTVRPVNDTPVAMNRSLTTERGIAKAVTLPVNDVDGDTLQYFIVQGPAHGALSGSGSQRTYQPSAGYTGPDSFTFKVNDGRVDSNTATVDIAVTGPNNVPTVSDQTVVTDEDTAKSLTLSATDADNDTLSYSIVDSPLHGMLTGSGASRIYIPAANYNGEDSFSYRVNDGTTDSATATIKITVAPVNDAPVANAGPDQSITAVGALTSVLLDGSASKDADSDALIYTWSEGAVTLATGVTPKVNLTTGSHIIVLTVTDPAGASSQDTVTVLVTLPASTANAKASGSGTLPAALPVAPGTKKIPVINFRFSASNDQKGLKGTMSLKDTQRGQAIIATKINSVVIQGTRASIYGVASANGMGAYNFVLETRDMSKKGAGADTFLLSVSNGYSESGVIKSGNITIQTK